MSEFAHALNKVGDEVSNVMGFSPLLKREERPPQLLLAGFVTPEQILKNPQIVEADIDALLIRVNSLNDSKIPNIKKYISDSLWGVHINQCEATDIGKLTKMGCDFFVFEMDDTHASVLEDNEPGKMLSLTGHIDENTSRGINDLLIDGILYTPPRTLLPLSILNLVEISSILALVEKPIIVTVPTTIKTVELGSLANAGIAAVSIPLTSVKAANNVKKAIRSIHPRKSSSIQRDALIPKDFTNRSHVADPDITDDGLEDSLN